MRGYFFTVSLPAFGGSISPLVSVTEGSTVDIMKLPPQGHLFYYKVQAAYTLVRSPKLGELCVTVDMLEDVTERDPPGETPAMQTLSIWLVA